MRCLCIPFACVMVAGLPGFSTAPVSGAEEAGGPDRASRQAEARIATIRAGFAEVEQDYARLKPQIDDMIRVRLDLTPALLLPGEPLNLTIAARAAKSPNPALKVVEGCYGKQPRTYVFELAWEKTASEDGFQATWRWRPPGRRC